MKHDGNTEMENGDRAEKKTRVRQSESRGDSDGRLNLRRSDRIRKRNARDNNTEDRDFRNNKIRVSEERKKKGTKSEDEVKNEEQEDDSDDNIRGVREANGEEEQTDDTHASASFQDITSFQNNEGTSALRSPSTSIHGLPTEDQLMTVTSEQLEDMKGRIESLHNKLDMLEAKERSLTAKIAELEQITLLHGETIRYILQHLQIQPFVLPPRPPPSAEDTDDHSYDTGSQSSDTMSS